jgi:hypothetical protein
MYKFLCPLLLSTLSSFAQTNRVAPTNPAPSRVGYVDTEFRMVTNTIAKMTLQRDSLRKQYEDLRHVIELKVQARQDYSGEMKQRRDIEKQERDISEQIAAWQLRQMAVTNRLKNK